MFYISIKKHFYEFYKKCNLALLFVHIIRERERETNRQREIGRDERMS